MERKFEKVTGYEDVNIPMRATAYSAGYDFEAAEDVTIPSIHLAVRQLLTYIDSVIEQINEEEMSDEQFKKFVKLEDIANELDVYKQLKQEQYDELITLIDDVADVGLENLSLNEARTQFKEYNKPTLIPTGIKAKMPRDEMLLLYNRSSNPLKHFLVLANGVGVIDSDYYNNEDNEGHIMFQVMNFGPSPITIKKGERIGQGIFQKFLLTTDVEITRDVPRTGGFGSTNKEEK
ncbi:hypothetical protein vipetofem_61 [Enterococcus phage vipetofem]|uniref:dUTP diphosphatase n=1 Tax=Enterococcus phage vipetofem TaxID=2719594 RepID=A0A6G9LMW9_9CAUD|nr:hypothetical protein KNU92_gp079 [Enterococcus phage vipetofem]QIQ66359.1 hypothetical protein vipetofem_61 [Enterococcus phage vipetofem]